MKEKLIQHIVKFSVYPISFQKLRRMEEEQLQKMSDYISSNRLDKDRINGEFLSYLD